MLPTRLASDLRSPVVWAIIVVGALQVVLCLILLDY